jgi:DNA-binding SARP family transcriptional activator
MDTAFLKEIAALEEQQKKAEIKIQTLGQFQLWRSDDLVGNKDWGRDITLQLFQFMITARHRHALHKEHIIDRIWEDVDQKAGDQNFKVALHGINKVLEPERKSRAEARFVIRQGLTYQLLTRNIWIDIDALESFIALGNHHLNKAPDQAALAFQKAIDLYQGIYLPNRLYEDWTSEERERIQVLSLGAFLTLAELLVRTNPMECIRLAQQALLIDATWEDAYRLQMHAYLEKGNRPMAIKTYQQCQKILREEFGIDPLPATQKVYREVMNL